MGAFAGFGFTATFGQVEYCPTLLLRGFGGVLLGCAAAQAVALAGDGDDFRVLQEAVEDGRGGGNVKSVLKISVGRLPCLRV